MKPHVFDLMFEEFEYLLVLFLMGFIYKCLQIIIELMSFRIRIPFFFSTDI